MHFSTIVRTCVFLLVTFNLAGADDPFNPSDLSWPFNARSFDMMTIFALLSSFLTQTSLTKLAASLTTAKLSAIGWALLIKLKPLMVVVGGLYMTSLFLGFLFPNSIIATTMRSLESSLFDQVNMHTITSMDPAEMFFNYMKVDHVCRDRAACELGSYINKEYPSVARGLRLFGEQIPFKYADSIVRGSRRFDCHTAFPRCPYNPMEL